MPYHIRFGRQGYKSVREICPYPETLQEIFKVLLKKILYKRTYLYTIFSNVFLNPNS